MKNILARVWQKVKLAVIIILSIAIGIIWTLDYQMFSEIKREADWAYSEAMKTRQLNTGIGEKVEETKNADENETSESKAVSYVPTQESESHYDDSRGGSQNSSPLSGVERIIYDIFGEEQYKMALAVAKAESRLDPKATNVNSNGSRDYGLFQCNSVHNPTEKEKTDPKANTELAKKIWEKSGWQAWSVVKNKRYLAFYN
jgi:hypothetical protein